jgi:hypothetical protein
MYAGQIAVRSAFKSFSVGIYNRQVCNPPGAQTAKVAVRYPSKNMNHLTQRRLTCQQVEKEINNQ